jgi:hypothetical protein
LSALLQYPCGVFAVFIDRFVYKSVCVIAGVVCINFCLALFLNKRPVAMRIHRHRPNQSQPIKEVSMANDHNTDGDLLIQYQIGPKTTHARHDSAHCLAPGLFRSLKKGDRKDQKLHVIYKFGKNELIEFKGPEPLGAEDLVVLQGLIAMSGAKKLILSPDNAAKVAIKLREKLELKWDAENANTYAVDSSFRKLAREIGYDPDSGGDLKTIFKSIERLWTVSIIVQSQSNRVGFKLLSAYGSNSKTGKLVVALNPRVTTAIFGSRPHTRINMDEVRKLKSDPARILHQRLSAIISPGEMRKILPDTLISYIWPDPTTGSTLRTRRQVLRKALAEIAATGAWEVSVGYQIKRKGELKKKAKPKREKRT